MDTVNSPGCTCGGEGWPSADAREQAMLMLSAAAFVIAGGRAVLIKGPRWFAVWMAGLLAWATVPKYFICTRCENYGKSCDFFYGGRYAALLFKKQDRPFNASGYIAEGASLSLFQFMPLVAARRDRKALAAYLLSAAVFQALLVRFCCIDCVRYSTDAWKEAYCPTWKMVERLGLAEPVSPSA